MGSLAPFGLRDTHGILSRPGAAVRASSEARRWTSMFASAQHELPYADQFPAVRDQFLVLHVGGPVEVEFIHGRSTVRRAMPAGAVHLVPGGTPLGVTLGGTLDTVHVYVRRAVIEDVAADLVGGDPALVEIPPCVMDADPALGHLVRLVDIELAEEFESPPIYVDCLARAIAARLVRAHATRDTLRRPVTFQPRARSAVVTRAIEYMQEHLDASVSIDDVASAAGRSASHFARQFRGEVGAPPHQYLLRLRVERAQELLAGSRLPLAEIALICGFSHQEHMTRLFRRHCGTTPAAYRRSRKA